MYVQIQSLRGKKHKFRLSANDKGEEAPKGRLPVAWLIQFEDYLPK